MWVQFLPAALWIGGCGAFPQHLSFHMMPTPRRSRLIRLNAQQQKEFYVVDETRFDRETIWRLDRSSTSQIAIHEKWNAHVLLALPMPMWSRTGSVHRKSAKRCRAGTTATLQEVRDQVSKRTRARQWHLFEKSNSMPIDPGRYRRIAVQKN